MMVMLGSWWGDLFSPFWRRWSLPLLLGGSLAFVAFCVMFVGPVRDRAASIFVGREDSSNNFRFNVWAAVFDMIRARPLTGIGPGNEAVNKIYPLFQRPRYTALSAYSIFLERIVEAGYVGFVAFLWMLGTGFYQGFKQIQRVKQSLSPQGYWLIAALAAQAGLLVQGLVDTVWYRPQVSMLWWLTMAIIASFYLVPQRQTASSSTLK